MKKYKLFKENKKFVSIISDTNSYFKEVSKIFSEIKAIDEYLESKVKDINIEFENNKISMISSSKGVSCSTTIIVTIYFDATKSNDLNSEIKKMKKDLDLNFSNNFEVVNDSEVILFFYVEN